MLLPPNLTLNSALAPAKSNNFTLAQPHTTWNKEIRADGKVFLTKRNNVFVVQTEIKAYELTTDVEKTGRILEAKSTSPVSFTYGTLLIQKKCSFAEMCKSTLVWV